MHPAGARRCPQCSSEVLDVWRVCPACEARLHPADDETKTEFLNSSAPASSTSIEEGRFPAGTVLAGRYRILGLIGKGGMGEVFRAYDVILNQSVALKFLSGAQISEAALARFRNEVRIARQVSHPNVCRVYDIGFVEGQHFLSMEYLDGEDLASLLRRIGRLPQDKAIEFARRICAGLSAAHERGVLHRDLKPANIMIDGRGHVRITDFGLAALAEEIAFGDLRSGTPAYMSPEQKAAREVTVRSDLYSLGLVFYEMFTGKRRDESQSSPSTHVKDLDPAVERLILRCLEEDPKRRPASAMSVAMALPGGDPIAAALAAGETPSPEMVAASGEKEGFTLRTAVLCFAAVIAALVVAAVSGRFGSVVSRSRLDLPPDALAYRAQEILKRLGYPETPAKTTYGFDIWDPYYLGILAKRPLPAQNTAIVAGRPPIFGFWYRQHRHEFYLDSSFQAPQIFMDVPSFDAPPNIEPGMIRMFLDPRGRLLHLEVRPVAAPAGASASAWQALFAEAELDPARFAPTSPTVIPPMAVDARLAWTGTYAEEPARAIRVEAGWWNDKAVFFNTGPSWKPEAPTAISGATVDVNSFPAVAAILFLVTIGVMIGAAVSAAYNLRMGRGDRNGARQLAAIAFGGQSAAWALTAAHVPAYWELHLVVKALGGCGVLAAVLWALYLGIEPHVRRHWPDSLISWSRLQRGRWRDPLVASHILVGLLVVTSIIAVRLTGARFSPATIPLPAVLTSLTSNATFAANLIGGATAGLVFGTGFLLLVVLLRLAIRRVWVADLISFTGFGLAFIGPGYTTNPQVFAYGIVASVATTVAMLWVMRRFGLLSLLTTVVVAQLLGDAPISLTTWYTGRSLFTLAIPAAIAACCLWVIASSPRRASAV